MIRLSRLIAAPALIAVAFALQPSVDAGMITGISLNPSGSAQANVSYSTFDTFNRGSATQTTSTGLTVAFAGGAAVVNGNAPSQYAPPTFSGANNQYFYTPATAPPNGPDATNYLSTGTGTITFTDSNGGPLGNYFGFLWGSADAFNSITFNFNDGTSQLITGTQLGFPFGGPTTYANFTASAAITSVVATSSIPSFEIDNVAFGTVPEPSSLAMVGLGLAGVGLVARRRRA